jgi:hypothetical protein
MEKMLDLFKERVEIKDMAEVAPLKVTEGLIEFGMGIIIYCLRRCWISV